MPSDVDRPPPDPDRPGDAETPLPGYTLRLRRRRLSLLPLSLAVAGIAIYGLGLGADRLSWAEIIGVVETHLRLRSGPLDPTTASIIWELRAPRVALALLVGGALAGAGVVFQALFRNPMADPYVIGVSAGSALGVVFEMTVLAPILSSAALSASVRWLSEPAARPVSGFVMGLATVLVVYRLAISRGRVHTETLLLAGVAVSLLLSALVTLLLVRSAGTQEFTGVIFWLMGGLADRSWADVLALSPWVIGGLLVCGFFARPMNLLLMGDETAIHLGVSPETLRRVLITAATVATAAAVSTSGVIGFVGLIIPHLVRLVWGPDHRVLLPASILAGAGFLVLADGLARTVLAPQEIPVGIITALAGAPFFLILLRRRASRL